MEGGNISLLIDLTGQTFNRLTVISQAIRKDGDKPHWHCICECGNYTIVSSANLKTGSIKSCGWLRRENLGKLCKRYNTYDLTGEYGIGYTLKGKPFYFDLEDYDKIKDYCWNTVLDGRLSSGCGKNRILLYRLVMNCPDNMEVDHIFHVPHDNRKSQLRIVTPSQNSMNQKIYSNNTSGYKGVFWVPPVLR